MKFVLICVLMLMLSGAVFSQHTTTAADTKTSSNRYEITQVTKLAKSKEYGLNSKHPVKVGTGEKGGPANQRAYLDLLRDEQGNPVKYYRGGSCCPYKSRHALFGGKAFVDRYVVEYKDKDGSPKQTNIYISFYDYEELMIPVGFQAVAGQ